MSNHSNSASLEFDCEIDEEIAFTDEGSSSMEPAISRSLRERHWTMLLVSVLVLVLSFTFAISDSGRTATILVWGQKMPSLCASRSWFGMECPGCGLTRSFVSLAAGDLVSSIRYHRLGWLLFLSVAFQIPYRIFSLRELQFSVIQRKWPEWFGTALIAALIGNWLLKIAL